MAGFLNEAKYKKWSTTVSKRASKAWKDYNDIEDRYTEYMDSIINKYNMNRVETYCDVKSKLKAYAEHPNMDNNEGELTNLLIKCSVPEEEICEIKKQLVIIGDATKKSRAKYLMTYEDKEALKIVKKSLKNLNLAWCIFRDEEGNEKLAEAAEEVEVVLDKYLAHLNN